MTEKYNFLDMIENNVIIPLPTKQDVTVGKIQIPIIQRDYAQGRLQEDKALNKTGAKFIKTIFETLKEGSDLELDFVYGSLYMESKEDKVATFIPLDGQQRLTTLFLLYWYIGSRELDDRELHNLKELLTKFTYKTRVSSRRFCELLCRISIDFKENPSSEIENLSEFFLSYKNDPTITAMLNMLDAIHEKYEELSMRLYSNLNKLTFYILPLEGFGLTEELYIKMNARGKQLTDFENLKADLTNWMKSSENVDEEKFLEKVEFDNRMTPFYLRISQKLDSTWTDFFWKMIKNTDKNNVDTLFLRFFYRYFFTSYILNSDASTKDITEDHIFSFFVNEGSFQSFTEFEKILNYTEITKFETVFDALETNWQEISANISPSWAEKNSFDFLRDKITQSERVVFCGIALYLDKNDFNIITFKHWMRVVWNLVENTDIADWKSAIRVMNVIHLLSLKSDMIYQVLSDNTFEIPATSSIAAIEEERLKCSIMFRAGEFSQEWEDAFIFAESHPFFKGSVGFLISEDLSLEDFEHRTKMAYTVFDKNGVNDKYQNNGHLFLRAIISQFTRLENLVGEFIVDTDESEHYLKKMLVSNEIVQNTLQKLFSLENEMQMETALKNYVSQESNMTFNNDAQPGTYSWVKKFHQDLYTNINLQDWIQNVKRTHRKALQLKWYNSYVYITRPHAVYDTVLLGTYRNEIINSLLEKPYCCTCDTQCSINESEIPLFWNYKYQGQIPVKRTIKANDELFEFEYIITETFLKVYLVINDTILEQYPLISTFIKRDSNNINAFLVEYSFSSEVKGNEDIPKFLDKIELDLFSGDNSFLNKIKNEGA